VSSLKNSLFYLLVFDKTTVDPEVGVMFVVFLGYQELLGKLGYLYLIVGQGSVNGSTSHGDEHPHSSDVVKAGHDIYEEKGINNKFITRTGRGLMLHRSKRRCLSME